ncbi:putative quinol monooxygenase [Pseudomonas citronellolis]|uniref:putative quinol monooxygenase n=1 Tax=Pseudomonas citronellolis TaxID=53408 RepID=UPI0023E42DCF|nr:putative quinol monooxygenase [Pseudomonas citronellolis]MDF3931498.1 putative quinol monooxygenase [Pseudomonas citronellolis]
MSTPITLIAIIRAKPGRADALQARLADLRGPSRAEAGCVQYDLHRDRKDPDLIYMVEQWRDEAAIAEHEASPHFQAFVKAAQADLAELDIRLMNRID